MSTYARANASDGVRQGAAVAREGVGAATFGEVVDSDGVVDVCGSALGIRLRAHFSPVGVVEDVGGSVNAVEIAS